MSMKMSKQSVFLAGFFLFLLAPALACNLGSLSPSPEATLTAPVVSMTPTWTESPSPTPGPGSIHGMLWHDVCQFTGGEAGEVAALGTGCVRWGTRAEEFGPNQEKDDFETGWAGVTLHLGAGACPAIGLATVKTDGNGIFRFDGLAASDYCVSYSASADGNDIILIPGGPTFPKRGDAGYLQTVTLAPGEDKELNFGYAWQSYN